MPTTTRAPKPFSCQECGQRYTLRGAERASLNGCRAGCSGADIDLEPVDSQLRNHGLRLADPGEAGWYVIVAENGEWRKVWAAEIGEVRS